MLLSPFIGMTAKVLLIEVNEVLDEITTGLDSEVNRYPHLDLTLYNYLREANILNQKKPFYPLPLLGVPNWHYCVQNNDFYANDAYFMPKRQRDAGV
jgi:hypothetical protein